MREGRVTKKGKGGGKVRKKEHRKGHSILQVCEMISWGKLSGCRAKKEVTGSQENSEARE